MARSCMLQSASSRRGAAAIELLIGIPLLLSVVALTFAVGYAGNAAIAAAMQAHRQAWEDRDLEHSRSPLNPGRLSVAADLVRRTARLPVPGLPPITGPQRFAESRHAVPGAGVWDDRDLHLSESHPVFHPSRELIEPVLRHVFSGP